MAGAQEVKISVGWAYEMEYVRETHRFGYNGNGTPITGDKAREEFTLWKDFTIPLGNLQTSRDNLGGWILNVQHASIQLLSCCTRAMAADTQAPYSVPW